MRDITLNQDKVPLQANTFHRSATSRKPNVRCVQESRFDRPLSGSRRRWIGAPYRASGLVPWPITPPSSEQSGRRMAHQPKPLLPRALPPAICRIIRACTQHDGRRFFAGSAFSAIHCACFAEKYTAQCILLTAIKTCGRLVVFIDTPYNIQTR